MLTTKQVTTGEKTIRIIRNVTLLPLLTSVSSDLSAPSPLLISGMVTHLYNCLAWEKFYVSGFESGNLFSDFWWH